ncbi:hypothetical protein MCOR25_009763 [Pyricularia grisea]|uniref:Heterokaryon incompatibility domain-containing protein n=1 Tax=Pyricularia grisea TaxID=148305 RepID=A0A6P8AXJ6_PYRGI|nr:hypothetical protein PgNI_10080 [Pyricularia grisea]KAI6351726.1 hypothetical protein MCOR25_009763 [Pyricularia grisea]TLD07006.1 hypothetical protein PgNI_10080 [Pyricularia grisea]
MSHWHEDWCVAPKVVLVRPDAKPRCDNCNKSPDVEALRASIAASHSTTEPPPDESPGQLNLFWPPTVQYGKLASTDSLRDGLDGTIARETTSSVAGHSYRNDTLVRHFSLVYDRRLEVDEFRLLVLQPSENENDPVHVMLETYHDDDCPEYETVSYTWGGEEDDAALCRPVYFGPGWEVIFQTKNCHAMLCHLRPKRGLRLLWVDALCINQGDSQERGIQVAKMGSIYGSSRRVVVFLGPEIITPLAPTSRYPARRGLEELAHRKIDHDDRGLHSVLERRYFGRIWVVQELLLPREVLMRVGDKEYVANYRLTSLIHEQNPDWDWHTTAAPWLGRISQGRQSTVATHLLRLAAGCAASDPRDLIFGLLGLLPMKWALEANYSLSTRHVHVGFLAHCLLNCRDLGVFQFAGRRDLTSLPSWTHPIGRGSREAEWLPLVPKRPGKGVPLGCSADSSDDDYDSDQDGLQSNVSNSCGDRCFYHPLQQDKLNIPADLAWWSSARIDSMDGSLTMRLVHLMPVLAEPSVAVNDAGFTLYTFAPPGGQELRLGLTYQQDYPDHYTDSGEEDSSTLSILFKGIRLVCQTAIGEATLDWNPDRDHIFILGSESSQLIPLVLREIPHHPQGYRLVFCGHKLDMMFQFDDDDDSTGGFEFSKHFGLLSETVKDRLQLIRNAKGSSLTLFHQVVRTWLSGGWSLFCDSTQGHELCMGKMWRNLIPKPPPRPPSLGSVPPIFEDDNQPDPPVVDERHLATPAIEFIVTDMTESADVRSVSEKIWRSYRGMKSTSCSAEQYLRRLRNRYTLIPTEGVRFCPTDYHEGSWTPPKDAPAAPDWPENIVDAYHIDGGVYEVTIF